MNKSHGMNSADVIVVGAGLAGLAAAEGVLRQKKRPVVIEKEEFVGGMCASIRKDGFVFDLGGHRFLPHAQETAEYVRGLFKEGELPLRHRRSQIYLDGKFLMYPPQAADIVRKLGWKVSLVCALEGLLARCRHAMDRVNEDSLKNWLLNRFGRALYDIYFGPYSRKLWGVDTCRISSDWAPQRVSVSSIGVVIWKLLSSRGKQIKTYARHHLYPVGGIGRIAERMTQDIRKKGGLVVTGLRVTEVTRRSGEFIIKTEDKTGAEKTFAAPRLISTIPLPEFVRNFSPRASEEVLEAADCLRFRSVRFLNLMLDVPEVTKNTWLYVPEERFIFFRIQEFNKWCSGNAPRGKAALTVELSCEKGDDIWSMSDTQLRHMCLRDLKKMGLDLKDKVLGSFSTYAEHAYPFYAIGYRRHLQKLYRFIEEQEDLVVCGRQGSFRYINMDRALEVGFQAAEAVFDSDKRRHLLKGKEDIAYVEANLYLKKK